MVVVGWLFVGCLLAVCWMFVGCLLLLLLLLLLVVLLLLLLFCFVLAGDIEAKVHIQGSHDETNDSLKQIEQNPSLQAPKGPK